MSELQRSPTNSRWRLFTALGLIGVVVLGVGAQWWIARPKRCAERFIAVVSQQKIADATQMLVDSTALTYDGNGNLTIKGTDGTSAVLSPAELPLIALEVSGAGARDGASDYLLGRLRFGLASSGRATDDGSRRTTEVYCMSLGGRVVVESVKQ
jgi:hypothetical protein